MTVKTTTVGKTAATKAATRKPTARKAATPKVTTAAAPAPADVAAVAAATPAAATSLPGVSDAILDIPVDLIQRNPRQPREYFETAELMELAASMAERGQLQPAILRQIGWGADERYELVIGERRWRAAKMNGAETLRAVLTTTEYTIRTFKDQVAENLNRADMTPIEEARAFRRILDDEDGATPESVARDFGKTTQFVNLRLKLLDLVPEVAEQVNRGAIGTQAAVQISQLTPANQAAVLKKWARGDFPTENDLVHFAYQVKEQQNQPFILAIEDLTEEQRAERETAQRATRSKLDKTERTIADLDALSKMTLPELVIALDGQFGARLEQLDRLGKALAAARFQVKQAKSAADARQIALNPDAVAPNLTGSQDAPVTPTEPERTATEETPVDAKPAADEQDPTDTESSTKEGGAEKAEAAVDLAA
ncbi:ParB/RepB/Spo0J family partition protein [Kitasatospora sp. NPDC004745]|uniref:ParB/RepB/Spo0J family partition protein n=1 Tax=Kitasatospora sp. NPDC004745 TaxID=3364019 RepID=UPI0036C68CC3